MSAPSPRRVSLLACVLALAPACGLALDCPPIAFQPVDGGSFHLYVSNQSFDQDPVDIQVRLDGAVAICDAFEVGSQHTWVEYRFALDGGSHTIDAASTHGRASLSETFVVSGEHWAVLDYWYYAEAEGGHEAAPRSFGFAIYDQPIGFD